MSYCPNCGKEIPDNFNYCPNCGEILSPTTVRSFDNEETYGSRTKKPSIFKSIFKAVMWVVAILAVLFVGLFAYAYIHRTDYYKIDSGWTIGMYVTKGKPFNYNSLARYPDDNKGKYTYFTGEVLQALESDDNIVEMRIATRNDGYGYYDDVMYVFYYRESGSRILEGDHITVYGQCDGTVTYEAVSGASITIPSLIAEYIKFN